MPNLSADVIAAAQAAQGKWGVPASISLSQFGVESAWGLKTTGRWNYFGIKANAAQIAAKTFTTKMTHEFLNGHYVLMPQPFADYTSAAGAFDAHAQLLATHPAYVPFMAKAKAGDIRGACEALTGVYATAPGYGDTLWSIIEADNLTQYDAPAAIGAAIGQQV